MGRGDLLRRLMSPLPGNLRRKKSDANKFPRTHMRTKTTLMLSVSLLLALAVAFNSFGEQTERLSRVEILALLPRGIDMLDANDLAGYNKLVSIGPYAHEALGEELLRVDDWITASRIIAVFVDSSGDKSVALKYLNRFLELPGNDDMWPAVRSQANEVITKFQSARNSSSGEQPETPPSVVQGSEAKPGVSSPGEEPGSTTPWSIIVPLSAAAIFLLWLAFRRRS